MMSNIDEVYNRNVRRSLIVISVLLGLITLSIISLNTIIYLKDFDKNGLGASLSTIASKIIDQNNTRSNENSNSNSNSLDLIDLIE